MGDTSVGKTSIIAKLVHGEFNQEEKPTIGAMFVLHVEMVGTRRVEMQVWDTAGQERYRALGPIYYRNAAAALAVFDLTSMESFEKLSSWITNFTEIAGGRALVVVVGNKTDLTDEIVVEESMVKAWTEQHHCRYMLTSAKEGTGITELFALIAEELVKHEKSVNDKIVEPEIPVKKEGRSQNCC
jgi:small GTP-binding protein